MINGKCSRSLNVNQVTNLSNGSNNIPDNLMKQVFLTTQLEALRCPTSYLFYCVELMATSTQMVSAWIAYLAVYQIGCKCLYMVKLSIQHDIILIPLDIKKANGCFMCVIQYLRFNVKINVTFLCSKCHYSTQTEHSRHVI